MKNLAITIALVALVGSGLGCASDRVLQETMELENRLAAVESRLDALERRRPAMTVIHLTSLEDGLCQATIDDAEMQQNVNKHVVWHIRDQCRPRGNWRVELDFGESSPFPETVVAGRVDIRERAVIEGEYTYKVWMRQDDGNRYELIDPELYIEP